ncbi:MAG: hypothetical protein DRI44_01455 [Chlamydiae bacterium]|nr:MAG: hypothetical protein DRI44_01455 [Chlamydiota bacterium]
MAKKLKKNKDSIHNIKKENSFTENFFDEFISDQPELFRVVAPIPDFIGHVSRVQYAFLSTERSEIYAVILNFLFLRRRAHEIEKYHNDVYDAVQQTIEELTGSDYTLSTFRADMEQLVSWNNLDRRLEPYRMQRISDRRLQKFLYKLSDGTRSLLDSLNSLVAPHELDIIILDQDNLYDIEEFLSRVEEIRSSKLTDEYNLRRVARCFADINDKCMLIATEITEFGAKIAAFNSSPFQLESLPEIIDWLDRYVDQYLQRVAKHGPELYHRIRAWNSGPSRELLDMAFMATREHYLSNPFAQPWVDKMQSTRELLADTVPFFAPEGLFTELCQRVNEQVRALVRKIRRHLDDIRRRNIRIKALRTRTREVMLCDEDSIEQVRAWLKELISSANQVNDRNGGTPSRRVAPPRPTYWRKRLPRPAFKSSILKPNTGSLELKRELEKSKIARLGRFINTTLLKGEKEKTIAEIELIEPTDVRSYLDAVKTYVLGRKRDKSRLSYKLHPPKTRENACAEFDGKKWKFVSPNYKITATKNGEIN